MTTYQDYNPITSPVAQRPGWYDRPQNGGGQTVDSSLPPNKFYGTEVPKVAPGYIASGQVLKAGTFLIENAAGEFIAAGALTESASVTFGSALTVGQTVIMAGLTFTATVGGATVAQQVAAWSDLTASAFTVLSPQTAGTGNATFTTGSTAVTFATAPSLKAGTALFGTSNIFIGILASDTSGTSGTLVANPVGAGTAYTTTVAAAFSYIAGDSAATVAKGGFFTAGTLTGYTTQGSDSDTVVFTATTALANATDVAATGTGTAPTIVISGGSATFVKPVAVTLYDVDATSAAVATQVYTEACFWGDDYNGTTVLNPSFLRWYTDPSETVYNASTGLSVACTSYNTGCFGNSTAMQKLKRMYVSGTEFSVYLSPPHNNVYDPNNNNYVGV